MEGRRGDNFLGEAENLVILFLGTKAWLTPEGRAGASTAHDFVEVTGGTRHSGSGTAGFQRPLGPLQPRSSAVPPPPGRIGSCPLVPGFWRHVEMENTVLGRWTGWGQSCAKLGDCLLVASPGWMFPASPPALSPCSSGFLRFTAVVQSCVRVVVSYGTRTIL